MKNLGYVSDCIFHRQVSEVVQKPNYWLIRNPGNPTHWWGNLLLYPEAPGESDIRRWLQDFRNEFGRDLGHVTFGWESEGMGELEAFKKLGFKYELMSVLIREKPAVDFPRLGSGLRGIEFREIASEVEWEQVTELQSQVGMESSDDPILYRKFVDKKFRQYRELNKRGLGKWFGAFCGTQLVGDMGLCWDRSLKLARFQSVETAMLYRRRGICAGLIRYVLHQSTQVADIEQWVIVTEPGSGAECLYKKQGFQYQCLQQGVCLPRKFAFDELMEI